MSDALTVALEQEEKGFVTRLQNRDPAAFRAALRRYHPAMVRLASAFVPSRSVAEEVAQETWLAVLEGFDRFEGRSSFRTWLFRILGNRARTRGSRERRMVPLTSLEDDLDPAPAVEPQRFLASGRWATPPRDPRTATPEALLIDAETRRAIEASIEALPSGQRAVITLRDLEGLDAAEVCAILDLSEANQRVILHRARARVRTALEHELVRRS